MTPVRFPGNSLILIDRTLCQSLVMPACQEIPNPQVKVMEKKIPLLSLVCAVLLVTALLSFPVAAQVSSVIIESYQVTPAVLMPGDKGTVTVTIRSVASGSQTSTVSYPDSGYVASSATTSELIPYVDSVILTDRDLKVLGGNGQFEGYVGPNQIIPLTFLIEVPAKSGLYFPEVWIRVRNGQSVKYPVPVNVNTQVSVMRLPSLTLGKDLPPMVMPGTTVEGPITVSNTGQVRADNIQLAMMTAGLPIAAGGSSSFLIDHLDPGTAQTINPRFIVDRDAASRLTEVPIFITYRLLDGSTGTQNESVTLNIRGNSEPGIAALETTPVRVMGGKPFDLIIRIENTGTADARSVSARVDLPFSGTSEAFIGTIRPGNDAPAVFTLDAGRPGTWNYTITVSYTDDWEAKTFSRQLGLTVYRDDGTWIALIVLIIIAVGGYVGYRWWKGRAGAS